MPVSYVPPNILKPITIEKLKEVDAALEFLEYVGLEEIIINIVNKKEPNEYQALIMEVYESILDEFIHEFRIQLNEEVEVNFHVKCDIFTSFVSLLKEENADILLTLSQEYEEKSVKFIIHLVHELTNRDIGTLYNSVVEFDMTTLNYLRAKYASADEEFAEINLKLRNRCVRYFKTYPELTISRNRIVNNDPDKAFGYILEDAIRSDYSVLSVALDEFRYEDFVKELFGLAMGSRLEVTLIKEELKRILQDIELEYLVLTKVVSLIDQFNLDGFDYEEND